MRQLTQSVRSGDLKLVEVPVPIAGPNEVLVRTLRTAISPGTERSVRELASAGLIAKARKRPDLVRQVIAKTRRDGVLATAKSVQGRLDEAMPLGYSGVGVVEEVGASVHGLRPGSRVATAGAGHAEYQVVSGLVAAPVPGSVSDENAAFTTIASVALHALRLCDVGPGSRVGVVGLGLLGQIACRIARASGYLVYGTDVREAAVDRARNDGFEASMDEGDATTRQILDWSRGPGVDAVVITAGTSSSAPMLRSTAIARDRAKIVVVGDVGLELDRRPFYERELSLVVARSYGPGRYDTSYEDWGVDYPIGHVRWTEGRNMAAVLDFMAAGTVDLSDLVSHVFDFEEVIRAYDLLGASPDAVGIQLRYANSAPSPDRSPVSVGRQEPTFKVRERDLGVGVIGAGNYVRAMLLHTIESFAVARTTAICSASGLSARQLAERHSIPSVYTDAVALIDDPKVDLVVIASSHPTHADLVTRALSAEKHVFCEKPLALTRDELQQVDAAYRVSGCGLQVGFNRRFAPAFIRAREAIADCGPIAVTYTVNAGALPESHWYNDRTHGGRILGEVCHFLDTISGLVGDVAITDLVAVGSGRRGALLEENLVVQMAFVDGSVASLLYTAEGSARTPKERVEVFGGGSSIVIDDYASLLIDGRRVKATRGKGHAELLTAYFDRLATAESVSDAAVGLVATDYALQVVESLTQNR